MVASATDRALDIADLLSTRKEQVERAYKHQVDTRGQLEEQSVKAVQEMFRLEGENRCLDFLLTESKLADRSEK